MYDWLDGWLRALPGAEHGYKEEWNWHRYTVRGRHFAACARQPRNIRSTAAIPW